MHYEAEKARRREMAEERRRVRRRATTSPCPSREALLDAWRHVRDSKEALVRFGSMVQDLECYVDNSLRMDERGRIVGRNAGIKGWLGENLPELAEHYSMVMRYKAAAKKLKQIVELADPTPVGVVLPRCAAELGGATSPRGGEMEAGNVKRDYGADEIPEGGGCEAAFGRGVDEVPELAVVRARAIWGEIVAGIGRSATALMARIDALTDPECADDVNMLAAWREKYANEITERTKKRRWRRLVKATDEKTARLAG
jgi:hypothetical protein